MRRLRSFAFIFALALPARASNYAASPAEAERARASALRMESLRGRADALKRATLEADRPDSDVHAAAGALFDEAIGSEKASAIVKPPEVRWEKPDFKTSLDVDGILDGMRRGVERGLKSQEVPAPHELSDADSYARSMRGLTRYGGLDPNVMGVYVYKEGSPIGIFFNGMMRMVQSFLGDQFAAATAVHEAAHARDHARGNLSPRAVKNGETLAFRTEYAYLLAMDPTGQQLAWARATFGKFAKGPYKAPEFVGEYLEHLAKIRRFGDHGDFAGLVESLGYQEGSGSENAERFCSNPAHGH